MAQGEINVSNMRVFRRSKHADAVMIICTDSPVPPELVEAISHIPHVEKVITLLPI
jgi:L-serine dehydratase